MTNKKIFSIILLFFITISILQINSFAADEFEASTAGQCGLITNLSAYIENEYGLASTEWECGDSNGVGTKENPYPIVISYPVGKMCKVTIDDSWITQAGRNDSGKEKLECNDVTFTSLALNQKVGDSVEEMKGSEKWRTYYIPAYATIYSSKQLGMENVNINIIDGKVKVTGVLNDDTAGWNVIFAKYKGVIAGILGICVLTCVAVFIILSIKMGTTAGNPSERHKVMQGMLVSGVGTALLGGVLIFFAFFWNLV